MAAPTLKQLRYFSALARHGHFGRAADASGISQPALSMQIRELEDTLGLELFERGARQVRLTAFGVELAQRADDILRAVEELGDLARAARERLAGQLRIGVIPTIAPYLLPAVIAQIERRHVGVELRVRESLTQRLIGEMADGKLDAAILAVPLPDPGFTEIALFTEAFVLVRPASEAGDPVPDAEALRGMRLLLLEEGHCLRDQALSFCEMRSARPRDLMDVSSLSTLVQMVGAGLGVTLIPEMAVDVETRSARVSVARFARAPFPSRTIGMVWRKTSPLAKQLLQIAELVRETATDFR